LRPTLKKSCLRNRPQPAAGGGGYSAAVARPQQPPQPSILESLPLPDQEKPAVPRGVAGFRLPIVPQLRPHKWSRQWCAAQPHADTRRSRAQLRSRTQGAPGAARGGRPAVLGAALVARRGVLQAHPLRSVA
jgi:hypothetical protein